jgi:hypothetical protein
MPSVKNYGIGCVLTCQSHPSVLLMLKNPLNVLFILFQIRAFGSEGMIEEMLRYLNIAENILWNINPYQKSDLYSIVLHALVDAKEVRINNLLILFQCDKMRIILSLFFVKHVNLVVTAILAHLISLNLMGRSQGQSPVML